MKELLKLIDSKYIISEIEKSRKEAAMIIFFICIVCASFDYILRKHGIIEDWFTQAYLIIGFLSFSIWAVKTFNAIADKVDILKAEKETEIEYKKKVDNICRVLSPLFNGFHQVQLNILKKFTEENSLEIAIQNNNLVERDKKYFINNINAYIYNPYKYHISMIDMDTYLIAKIEQEFLDVLKVYFRNKL